MTKQSDPKIVQICSGCPDKKTFLGKPGAAEVAVYCGTSSCYKLKGGLGGVIVSVEDARTLGFKG
ncbi:hypothetical protein [Geovibrio ferrireducens]|uniref:hypothetical protein n=1 Tax=Geovibrio ferrireducens TaxID=46201 RepID=UPI002247EFCB|nr:hypothetical protein [Geovibrio ferrireducens]